MNLSAYAEGEITSRRDIAPRYWIVQVRCDSPPTFLPGQFATLGVRHLGRIVERPYSIVSSPREPQLEFFLQLVREGELTRRLHALHPGDPVFVRRVAKGVFRLDETSGRRKHFMVATVTGVAPFVSMVRTLRADERAGTQAAADHEVFLLHGASYSGELGYDRELSLLEREVGWFQYVPVISRPREDPGWSGERGRLPGLLAQYLARFGCEPAETTVYLCGNPRMIKAAKHAASALGFRPEAIKEERFWVEEGGAPAAISGQSE